MEGVMDITEIVLTYDKLALDAWRLGDKRLIPDWLGERSMIMNQPTYHFGEVFVLDHLFTTDGWMGYRFFAIGEQWPHSELRRPGRNKISEIIPESRLKRFRSLRTGNLTKTGAGEPDLFLFKPDGQYKFAEVKKQGDKIRPVQLQCMAHIAAILECPVEIYYLRERKKNYIPKTYVLDLDKFEGELKRY
jgi:hypothetical protein